MVRKCSLLEGVAITGLLYSLDDGFVDTERNGDAEKSQKQVREDTDNAKCCQRQQQQQGCAKHHTRFLRVPPVHQVMNCKIDGHQCMKQLLVY